MTSLATFWLLSIQLVACAGASGRWIVWSTRVSMRLPSGRSTGAVSPTRESISIAARLSGWKASVVKRVPGALPARSSARRRPSASNAPSGQSSVRVLPAPPMLLWTTTLPSAPIVPCSEFSLPDSRVVDSNAIGLPSRVSSSVSDVAMVTRVPARSSSTRMRWVVTTRSPRTSRVVCMLPILRPPSSTLIQVSSVAAACAASAMVRQNVVNRRRIGGRFQ